MTTGPLRTAIRLQDRLVRLLGNTVEGRSPLVAAMLKRDASEATSYWLQLVVAIGIATLGLVVGSTAVIIGAMLVAPLMGPIVGLAMGLAAGSPFLVLRSAGRIGMSVVAAVGGAAVITLLLPFHELNAEISARTSPTVLDLITASFCALAGVYASLRPGSETAATAAGTSIGISLAPPLCASGYGLGTANWAVATGASLLFLTNLVAIVVVGTVAFLAAGFNRIDVLALERTELEKDAKQAPVARALARRLSTAFESRWGPALRFLMPFLLLAGVYIPLRRALDEVAWEVRVRAAVRAALAKESSRVIESRIRVERHAVEVVLVILGRTADADAARARIDAAIRAASAVAPRLEIFAVPDAASFAGLESTLLTPREVASAGPHPTQSPDQQLEVARARIQGVVDRLWPTDSAGEPLVIDVGTADKGALRLRVVHLGSPLGADAAETVRRAVASALGREVALVDVAVPAAELTREGGDVAFAAQVSSSIRSTSGVPAVRVCVARPADPPWRHSRSSDMELARVLDELLALHPRVTTTPGAAWGVRFVAGPCPTPDDAGATSAAPRPARGLDGGNRPLADPAQLQHPPRLLSGLVPAGADKNFALHCSQQKKNAFPSRSAWRAVARFTVIPHMGSLVSDVG